MILSKEKIEEFNEVIRPAIKWMDGNLHPHTYIIVDSIRAELVEGVCSVNNRYKEE